MFPQRAASYRIEFLLLNDRVAVWLVHFLVEPSHESSADFA